MMGVTLKVILVSSAMRSKCALYLADVAESFLTIFRAGKGPLPSVRIERFRSVDRLA
jgi:hypothetical protein